jgi:hypothetical protein
MIFQDHSLVFFLLYQYNTHYLVWFVKKQQRRSELRHRGLKSETRHLEIQFVKVELSWSEALIWQLYI